MMAKSAKIKQGPNKCFPVYIITFTLRSKFLCKICLFLFFVLPWRYYEDLKCPEVDREIETRLERGDPVTLATGKLLDRVLLFHLLQAGHSTNIADREKEICEVYNTWDWDAKPEGPGEWECVPDPDVASFSARLENIAQKQIEKIR